MKLVRSAISIDCGLPCDKARSAPAIVFRGLLSVHSRYGLHARRVAKRPLHRKLRQLRCLRCRFDCYRVERTSSRAGVTPAEVQRLSRRTLSTTIPKLRAEQSHTLVIGQLADDGQSQVQTVRPGQSGRQPSARSNCHTRRIGKCIVFRIRQVVGGVEAAQRESWFRLPLTVYCLPASGFMTWRPL